METMRLAWTALAACLMAAPTQAQMVLTFPMSFAQFRTSLDAAIRADTLPHVPPDGFTTKSCAQRNNRYDCSFNDAGFRSALRFWQRTGILPVSGPVSQVLHLTAVTSGGQLGSVVVTSIRSDMINLMVPYLSTVVAVMRVFEPGIGEDQRELAQLVKELGLMRGDADPTIGKPATMTIAGALVSCTNWNMHLTDKVECVFTPL